ncbi:hypothetical protein LTS18_005551 [Coniosporium uncinatum]|uniref:Uncharacterized protein n=1 Tax=Coniosporium uncinatum TaxID=93489 RepID=A0ACC3D4W2_9PEZI|nr:hypothetical protein LTS18_005551 [Coniosporium uncinatum]
MGHAPLESKQAFDDAIATKGKYVLIYAYENEVDPKAEAASDQYEDRCAPFKVDVVKYPQAKNYFNLTSLPSVVIYKDGDIIKKIEGLDREKAQEIKATLES